MGWLDGEGRDRSLGGRLLPIHIASQSRLKGGCMRMRDGEGRTQTRPAIPYRSIASSCQSQSAEEVDSVVMVVGGGWEGKMARFGGKLKGCSGEASIVE